MKLTKNDITIETNTTGEITSILFKNIELLHNGEQWWKKTYPMIWPNISFSEGFEVNGKNYQLPKHGFWKELKWESIFEGESISLLATHHANDVYPFTIDIQHNISVENNEVVIKTTFSNLSNENAYFHFGHHPAFVIEEDSILKTNMKEDLQAIDLDGKLTKDTIKLKPLMELEFGQKYDTLVYKDVEKINISLIRKNVKITFDSQDFASLQIWKPKDALFVCVEPWQGWNDREYDAPKNPAEKIDIIALNSGEIKEFEFKFKVENIK